MVFHQSLSEVLHNIVFFLYRDRHFLLWPFQCCDECLEFAKGMYLHDCCDRHFTNYIAFDHAPLKPQLNSNVPRPFFRPNKIKWQIKGRLRQANVQ